MKKADSSTKRRIARLCDFAMYKIEFSSLSVQSIHASTYETLSYQM